MVRIGVIPNPGIKEGLFHPPIPYLAKAVTLKHTLSLRRIWYQESGEMGNYRGGSRENSPLIFLP